MDEQFDAAIQTMREKYQECLESKERVRAAMEQALLEYEALELKYKNILEENEELKQKIFVLEQMMRERKWSEWMKCEE